MNNRPELHTDAERMLDLQLSMKEKTKNTDRLTILLFLSILFLFGALVLILPDRDFSEQENRSLQTFPRISSKFEGSFAERIAAGKFLDRLIDGSFIDKMGDYYADQFPFRDAFVGLKGITEIAMLKGENNDVILGKNGYIIKREDFPNLEYLDKNTEAIALFGETLAVRGTPLVTAIAGRSVDVLPDKLPSLFPRDRSDRLLNRINTWGECHPTAGYLDLCTPLKILAAENPDLQIYYRTDHHWTTTGAYYAYAEILRALGREPLPASAFTIETASDSFYGTTWSSAGMKWIAPDDMLYYRYAGDEDYTVVIQDTKTELQGFYDRSYLSKKDKYSSFLGGNYARIDVSLSSGENRPRLLVIKDSYAHSVIPFLAYHYDITAIDLRYFHDSAISIIENEGIDEVLILCYNGSLTSGDSFIKLRFGLNVNN